MVMWITSRSRLLVTDPRETGETDSARRGRVRNAGYVCYGALCCCEGVSAPGAPALWWEVMNAYNMLRLLLAAVLVVLAVGVVACGGAHPADP